MTSSPQTKRSRRRGRAKRRGQRSTDKLNKALGEFLTEMGRVEFTMLLYADYINEAPIEHLFDESSRSGRKWIGSRSGSSSAACRPTSGR